jgi:hypothetical protein
MLKANLWNQSTPRVELDQRAREARLRLEELEHLLVPRAAATGSWLKYVLCLFSVHPFSQGEQGRRTGGSLSNRRLGRVPENDQGLIIPSTAYVRRPVGWRAKSRSDLAENALDLADSSAVDLGDLGDRHAVFHQGADAGKLRPRDRARRLRLGNDWGFGVLVTDRGNRCDSQNARFARWSVGWWRSRI